MHTSLVEDFPPFKLNKSRFDQTTFSGRLRHFLDVTDPRTLLTSEKKLNNAIKLLESFKNGVIPPGTLNKQLWDAQKIKQAIIHPDTGEKILPPFRMSGYVPFGSPIVVGMLLPNPTIGGTILWQWINQSHNACVNYANRNASKPTPTRRFVLGYVGAVTTAVSIAVGLSFLIKKANGFSPATKMLIQKFVPFPAVSAASTCNVILMRNNELWEGIEVFDENEEVVGTSLIAAKKALKEMALTRAILPAPLLLIPAVVMATLERKTTFLKRFPRMHLPINAAVCTASFAVALPLAIALFPQVSEVKTNDLEDDIRSKVNKDKLYYNKGL